jgi:hypothetical protein
MQRWHTLTRGLCLVLGTCAFLGCTNYQAEQDRRSCDRVWLTFKDSPSKIDVCARKLAYAIPFSTYSDWPSYCNQFRDTPLVQARVKELRESLETLQLSDEQRSEIKHGVIWVGASAKAAELSWGRPEHINRTITAGKNSEQWV